MENITEIKPTLASVEELWYQAHERLCRFVCSRLANEDDAEDILQDVFLRIHQQVESVRDPSRLESWMYQVARNRIIDHYRARRQWVELSETLASDEDPEEELPAKDLLPILDEAVKKLPEAYQEAVVLSEIQGMDQKDLAARLNISLSGAKSRVQRGRQKLREALTRCLDFDFDLRGQLVDYQPRCCC